MKSSCRPVFSENPSICEPVYQASYDVVAEENMQHASSTSCGISHSTESLLDRFAAIARGKGLVSDLGCGPGHVARYLQAQGVDVCGYDLSPKMVELARQLTPGIKFQRGDMTSTGCRRRILGRDRRLLLPHPHRSRADGPNAQGTLESVATQWIVSSVFPRRQRNATSGRMVGKTGLCRFLFSRSQAVTSQLRNAGFEVAETIERDPYPEVEHQSRRAYIIARKPVGA